VIRSAVGGVLSLCLAVTTADATELGRLFFTPAERDALDAERRAAAAPPAPPRELVQIAPAPAAPAKPPAPVTMNGIVTRSTGPGTVWINGESQDLRHATIPGDPSARVRVAGETLRLAPGDTPGQPRLRPGQTYDPERARVIEAYDTRAAGPR
jgi:hypothetical protein